MARRDPHSWSDDSQPEVAALELRARVDFPSRTLEAEALLRLRAAGSGPLDLDTRDLHIDAVTDERGAPLGYALEPPRPVLGARLRVMLPEGTAAIRIRYRTSPSAIALKWLPPGDGRRAPLLYSQCQPIHARSLAPLQDTPRLRIRFTVELTVPRELRALVAAASVGRELQGDLAVERFAMEQPVPPYLLAFAVGELEARELGPRSRVWAEPALVERAAQSLGAVEEALRAAERLFGPYPWERFDLLVMPPSFPYGGMENPRLAFVAPTALAGERGVSPVVVHELAHAWTGNLVSAASAEHFWLNEGFTVFAERKILAALDGPEEAELHAALGRRQLDEALAALRDHPELQRLRLRLDGADPDEALSVIAYEKGFLLLRALEEQAGEARFAGFLRDYLDAFRFRSLATEELVAFLDARLPGAGAAIDLGAWLDEPGIPPRAPALRSPRLDALAAIAGAVDEATGHRFSPVEWQLYLASLPHPSPAPVCATLDERFQLTRSAHVEVLVAWLALAVESEHAPALPRLEALLGETGRMKHLKPLYLALARRPATRALAADCFRRHRAGYHPIARRAIDTLLRQSGVPTATVSPVGLGRKPFPI